MARSPLSNAPCRESIFRNLKTETCRGLGAQGLAQKASPPPGKQIPFILNQSLAQLAPEITRVKRSLKAGQTGREDLLSFEGLDQNFWTDNEGSPASHALFYPQTAGVRCQNNLRGDTHKYALHTSCIFTRTARPSRSTPTYARALTVARTPNTLCRAAAGVSAGVTRHVSHSILLTRTGDSPRGQKWAKDSNPIPGRKSGAPASAPNVIRSSCDTAAMCWGLFLRNGRVELESSRISLVSVWTMNWSGPAGGIRSVCVCSKKK